MLGREEIVEAYICIFSKMRLLTKFRFMQKTRHILLMMPTASEDTESDHLKYDRAYSIFVLFLSTAFFYYSFCTDFIFTL